MKFKHRMIIRERVHDIEQHNLAANGVKQCLSVQSLDSRVYCPLGTMGHSVRVIERETEEWTESKQTIY